MKIIDFKYKLCLLFITVLLFSACNEDYLVRLPQDAISSEDYWKTTSDLELYVNQFYPSFPDMGGWSQGLYWSDTGTDNLINEIFDSRLGGTRIVPSTGGGWSWGSIRSINIFFDNYKKCTDNITKYKQYLGEAHFFRAYFYFNMVRSFGDVPYFTKQLYPESEELYAPKIPRNVVIDNIIADLDKAIEYMTSGPLNGGTQLNKEIAQLYKSRVCLYEGTWEKYQNGTPFGISDANPGKYLQLAADAALGVINSGKYSIYSTGKPKTDYEQLFIQNSYSGNTEVMLWRKYDLSLSMYHNHNRYPAGRGVTRDLVYDYLCSDGLPRAVSSSYKGDNTLTSVLTNRDQRLNQTVFGVGDPLAITNYPNGNILRVFTFSSLGTSGENNCITGYQKKKGFRPDADQTENSEKGITGDIIFRYAEALLNYAEAKAEMGTLTQADVDKTINVLRNRVGMPPLMIGNIVNDPNWLFPGLSPVLNEVRRERRIELSMEGYRWDDLARWRAHGLFVGKRPKGIKFDPVMYPKLVPGTSVMLDVEGYVDHYIKQLPNGYQFKPDRDYLSPIPTQELTLNKNLTQNPGW